MRLLCVFLLLPVMAVAQQLRWSDTWKETKYTENVAVAGTDSTGWIIVEDIRDKQPSLLLRRMGTDLREESQSTILLPQPESCPQEFSDVFVLGDHVLVFTTGKHREEDQYQAYVSEFDLSGKLVRGPMLVHYAIADSRTMPQLVISFSPATSLFAVVFDPPYERRANESISIKVYDRTFDLLWEKELELPYDQDVVQVHQYLVDNSGRVYLMSGENPSKGTRQWQKPQGSRYVMFFYDAPENKLKEYDISLRDKQVTSVRFALNEKGELVIAGYYSNDFQFASAGTFLFVLSPGAASIQAASFMAFPKDLLAHFMSERIAERDGTLPDLYLDHLLLNQDGGCTLVGERFEVTEQLVTDLSTGRQMLQYRYNFDDIVVTKLGANGRIEWSRRVAKHQYDNVPRFNASYALFAAGDSLSFFFNDHADNAERFQSGAEGDATGWGGSRQSITARVDLMADGSQRRSILASNREADALLSPSLCARDVFGRLLLGYEDGRSYRFATTP